MARPTKKGLDYIPLDVDFFDDDKLKFVSARFDEKGEIIAVKLLCKIYKTQGYFYQWGEDEAILFATGAGKNISPALVNDVVHELVKRSFFDKRIFDRFKILTSNGIQTRYWQIVSQSKLKRDEIDPKLDVRSLTQLKTALSSEETNESSEDSNINPEESPQSKVKERKLKEMKEKSVENAIWVSESCAAYSTDPLALLEYCSGWILKAIPTGKIEQYSAQALIRFMLTDFEKEKNSAKKEKENKNGISQTNKPDRKIGRISESTITSYLNRRDDKERA